MGCNCKKTYDKMVKYSDGYTDEKTGVSSTLLKVTNKIAQFFFGILVGGIVIVMIVPIVVFLIGCLIVGKEPNFNFTKKKKDTDGK